MYLGLDFGTSGARACVLDDSKSIQWEQRIAYSNTTQQTAQDWRNALYALLDELPQALARTLQGVSIDGTSGTVLLCDAALEPIGPALLYNDVRAVAQAEQLAALVPNNASVCSPASGLAKLLWLTQHHQNASHMLHQADWLTALLSGQPGISDYHNALKSGYDVERLCWPDWVRALPMATLLPKVVAPGTLIGTIQTVIAARYGIAPRCRIFAGTTDSIAAFIASGVRKPGTGVTSLGTTLVLKQLSPTRIEAPEYGIYSHRFGKLWLLGGASNAGAGVLRQFFDDVQLKQLSLQIDANQDSPLDYYPLPKTGERFPIHDPKQAPRMTPRPTDDASFLHGLLQGLARIEAAGYAKLAALGAAPINSVLSNGGGARNQVWNTLRSRLLNLPVYRCEHMEAAYGAALLAFEEKVLAPIDE